MRAIKHEFHITVERKQILIKISLQTFEYSLLFYRVRQKRRALLSILRICVFPVIRNMQLTYEFRQTMLL